MKGAEILPLRSHRSVGVNRRETTLFPVWHRTDEKWTYRLQISVGPLSVFDTIDEVLDVTEAAVLTSALCQDIVFRVPGVLVGHLKRVWLLMSSKYPFPALAQIAGCARSERRWRIAADPQIDH